MTRWAAIILASLSWLFAFRYYVAGDPVWQWGLLASAVLLGALGLSGYAGRLLLSKKGILVLVPVVIALIFASPAYRPGLYVLAVGVALLALAPHFGPLSTMQPVGLSATIIGTVFILQSASFWLCTGWTARNPEIPYLGQVLYWLLAWIGADVSYSGGTLYVRTMRHVHKFPLLWEHFALFPMMQIWLAGLLILWWDRARRSFAGAAARLTVTLAGYGIIRLFVLIPVFVTAMLFVGHESDTIHVEVFWLPWITAVSFLPLIPILARLVPWSLEGPDFAYATAPEEHPRQRARALMVACLGALGATVAIHYWDPGVHKAGRVLLDESHSHWERTDQPYTTDWYGHESGYNYYCMAQYLDHFYDLDFNMDGKLTQELLANYDVLILKTPTEAYDPDEQKAIEQFVLQGGGLFVHGEHTNVFGSSVALNPVTRRFGIAFNYDCLFDITRRWEQVHLPMGLKENRLIGARLGVHPIMQDVPFFRFAVSCSLATDSWKVRPVIRSTGLWELPIEWAAGNFYPHVEDSTYARFGAFNQVVSTTAGEGRVVAFTDSTVYSNFLSFYPGKPEFLLGSVDWLNRTNRNEWVNTAGLAVFVASMLVLLVTCVRLKPNLEYSAALMAWCGATVWVGMWVCALFAEHAYSLPKPHQPVHEIVFDMDYSTKPAKKPGFFGDVKAAVKKVEAEYDPFFETRDVVVPKKNKEAAPWPNSYELPLFAFTQRYSKSWEIFYQWVLRLGYYTTVSFDLDKALERGQPVVLVDPLRSFSPEIREAIRKFLESGGSMLVLDSPGNEKSTSNQLLESFGMSLDGPTADRVIHVVDGNVRVCGGTGVSGFHRLGKVTGGTPILASQSGDTVAAYQTVGKGLLVAAGLSERFDDTHMGTSSRIVPSQEVRAVYELEFALMRGLVEKDVVGQMKALAETFAPKPDKPVQADQGQ